MANEGLDVAVIGLAAVYPGAPDAAALWRNVESGHDAISELPEGRMDRVFFDPSSRAVDRIYCWRGGFLPEPLDVDAAGLGVMPRAAAGADPDQLLTLQAARACLADAGYDDRAFDRERAGVVLGRGGYLTPGLVRLDQKVRGAEQLCEALRLLVPGVDEAAISRIKEQFQERAGIFGPDTAIGLVPNLAASRLSNRLDLRGPAYTVDAACASSLLAVDHACREIASGRCETVIAGGVHVTQDPTFWAVFCQLGALSPSGTIRPFDTRADGMLIGEGIGLLLLKEGKAAARDGDRVYARIRGVGVASDGRSGSLFSPGVDGQVLALERAWREARRDPATVGLVEAHGTGTPAGDAAELETLRRVFGTAGDGPRAVVGSVKSMIGHAMPAAGAASLVKTVLALHHGVLPPTLHCEEPHAALERTRFRVIARKEPWSDTRRIAAVSAFGFGGINAHVVLEAEGRGERRKPVPALQRADAAVLALAADSPESLLEALDAGCTRGGDGPARLAVVDPTPERLAKARKIVEQGAPWRGRHGIWWSPRGLALTGGKVLFMYPGVEATFEPSVDDVATHFGLAPPTFTRPANLEETGQGVVSLGLFLHRALTGLAVTPDAFAGHSTGEWTGMMCSGILDEDEVYGLIRGLAPGSLEVPGVLFAAAGCGMDAAKSAMEGLADIAISHDNCPHQVILCGRAESIEEAKRRLIQRGVICQVLPFRSGFHSPLFEPYLAPHGERFGQLPIRPWRKPMWSATTCEPYPREAPAVRELALAHLVRRLRFRELVARLYDEGFRIFVQVGVGSLVGFVEDCLRGLPHLAVAAHEHGRPGLAQLRNLALALHVEGVPVSLPRVLPRDHAAGAVRLDLGSRLVRLDPGLALQLAPLPADVPAPVEAAPLLPPDSGSVVMAMYERTLEAMSRTQRDVVDAFRSSALAGPGAAAQTGKSSWSDRLKLSVHTVPALRDHSFFPQPVGWSVVSDGYPVVPMTMSIELLLQAARQVAPDRIPIVVHDIEAFRWLVVEPEVEVRLSATRTTRDEVQVELEGYAKARIRLAARYPTPPAPDRRPLEGAAPPAIGAAALYTDRWMFHGPRYQGVDRIDELGNDGVRGVLRATDAPGALLDNAGQLFGYWVMATQPLDRLAMPIGIPCVEFFGTHPTPGERVECRVRILALDGMEVRADIELVRDGHVWCRIHGWTDLRFSCDERTWKVMRVPEENVLALPRPGYVFYDAASHRAPSRDWLMRRYLGEPERKAMLASGPRNQRFFLNERIAAKDAVRGLLWSSGHGPIFPVEVRVDEEGGRLALQTPSAAPLHAAVDHDGDVAVAAASALPVAIAILATDAPLAAPTVDELAVLEQAHPVVREEWHLRIAAARKAAERAGVTLTRDVVAVQPGSAREPDTIRVRIDDLWFETRREGRFVVAVTLSSAEPS